MYLKNCQTETNNATIVASGKIQVLKILQFNLKKKLLIPKFIAGVTNKDVTTDKTNKNFRIIFILGNIAEKQIFITVLSSFLFHKFISINFLGEF